MGLPMTMAWLRPVATICIAAVVFAGAVQAQTLGTSANVGRLMAQTPPDRADPFASGGLTGVQQANALANLVVTEKQKQTQTSPN